MPTPVLANRVFPGEGKMGGNLSVAAKVRRVHDYLGESYADDMLYAIMQKTGDDNWPAYWPSDAAVRRVIQQKPRAPPKAIAKEIVARMKKGTWKFQKKPKSKPASTARKPAVRRVRGPARKPTVRRAGARGGFTVVQLKQMCRARGIVGYSRWRKATLLKKCV